MSENPTPQPTPEVVAPQLKRYRCAVRSHTDLTKLEILEVPMASRDEVIVYLQSQNYLVISVREAEEPRTGLQRFVGGGKPAAASKKGLLSVNIKLPFFNKVSNRELIGFVIQLSALLRSGVPLLQSLKIVRRGTQGETFQGLLDDIVEDVKQGFSFHHAIAKKGKAFPDILPNLVEVGEVSGNLVEVLEEIAHYLEASARITGKVISAFFYPAILMCLALSAVVFLLINIIPKFETVFVNLKIELPFITKVVMFASKMVRGYGPLLLLGFVGIIFLINFAVRHPKGKLLVHTLQLKIPVIGSLFLEIAIVRLTRAFATMLHAGIPILSCLKISAKLTANARIMKIFDDIHDQVQAGHGLGFQLEKTNTFPPFMTSLITVGEESGELVRFLKLIADYYEERVDTFLNRLGSVLEPLLLVCVGAIIGVIVIAVFLPLMEISTMGGH